jgi:class 3 adenylate cyclase
MDRRYDIWGPDVMVAHKLEGQGYPGKIHASKAAVQYLQDSYVFEKSGKQVEVAPSFFSVF